MTDREKDRWRVGWLVGGERWGWDGDGSAGQERAVGDVVSWKGGKEGKKMGTDGQPCWSS